LQSRASWRDRSLGRLINLEDVALLTLYAVDVSAIMLLLALWRFRTKELI
jgi:hypothetical protein